MFLHKANRLFFRQVLFRHPHVVMERSHFCASWIASYSTFQFHFHAVDVFLNLVHTAPLLRTTYHSVGNSNNQAISEAELRWRHFVATVFATREDLAPPFFRRLTPPRRISKNIVSVWGPKKLNISLEHFEGNRDRIGRRRRGNEVARSEAHAENESEKQRFVVHSPHLHSVRGILHKL